MGRPEEAIPHFRAAVAAYPYDPNTDLNLGIYEQMHGNYTAAIDWYQKAANMARNSKIKARAYNNLGYAYKESGDYITASENLKKAVKADPEFAGAWISLGLMAQRTGDMQLAVNAYSRGVQLTFHRITSIFCWRKRSTPPEKSSRPSPPGKKPSCLSTDIRARNAVPMICFSVKPKPLRQEFCSLSVKRVTGVGLPGAYNPAFRGEAMTSVASVPDLHVQPGRTTDKTIQAGGGPQRRAPRCHGCAVLPRDSPSLHQHRRPGLCLRKPPCAGGPDVEHVHLGDADVRRQQLASSDLVFRTPSTASCSASIRRDITP